jgi:hypothetical protein
LQNQPQNPKTPKPQNPEASYVNRDRKYIFI